MHFKLTVFRFNWSKNLNRGQKITVFEMWFWFRVYILLTIWRINYSEDNLCYRFYSKTGQPFNRPGPESSLFANRVEFILISELFKQKLNTLKFNWKFCSFVDRCLPAGWRLPRVDLWYCILYPDNPPVLMASRNYPAIIQNA